MRPTRHSGTTQLARRASVTSAVVAALATLATAAVTAAVTAAATLAATAPNAGAVVNGTPSDPAPWAVQITSFSYAPGAPCTGVVVDPYWVATAAHCGPPLQGDYTLAFGNWATLPGGTGSSASVANPGVVSGFGALDGGSLGRHAPVAAYHAPAGDLMLLKLAHPAPSPAVKRAEVDPAPGSILQFHGFGETQPFGLRSPLLLTGHTRLDRMEPRGGSWIGQNTTVQGGYSPGDSGAPVFQGDLLVGLHTISDRGSRQADGTISARYESIPAQNDWINWMIANR